MTTDEKLDGLLIYVKRMKDLQLALADMGPLVDGSSGIDLGIYEQAARNVCKAMEWEFRGSN